MHNSWINVQISKNGKANPIKNSIIENKFINFGKKENGLESGRRRAERLRCSSETKEEIEKAKKYLQTSINSWGLSQ